MPAFINITGQRFGHLVAVARQGTAPDGHVLWWCRCDCGKTKLIPGGSLRSGSTKSFGCYHSQQYHHRSKTPIWNCWKNMLQRCYNPKNPCYKNYGGRGIIVCDRWKEFVNFLADMGERPAGMSLDRINNDGNYEPGNCRWATRKQQSQNRRPRS